MLRLVGSLDADRYQPRKYVWAATDAHSHVKMEQFEATFGSPCLSPSPANKCLRHHWGGGTTGQQGQAHTAVIPRSREVGQSYFTSLFTTAFALLHAVAIVLRASPELVLFRFFLSFLFLFPCLTPPNRFCVTDRGRAFLFACRPTSSRCPSAALSALSAMMLDCVLTRVQFFGKDVKIVYVESIARVESLSLSGKLLYRTADYFLVQWPQLKAKYPAAQYLGRLC
jgi:beta-1,4-N-acetylglucosaminyltransferase